MLTRLKRYLAVAVLLGAGGWLAVDGWHEMRAGQRLSREATTVEGKVIDHSSSYRYKRGLQYYLTVEFQPQNYSAITETFNVEADVYHGAVQAGVVTVRYLPDNPEVCTAGGTVTVTYRWLLMGAGMFLGGLYLLWFFRHAGKQIDTLCVDEHEFETVDASQFRQLDYAFYEEGRHLLETHGYRFLADREDVTFRRSSGLRIALRLLVSRDGGTVAALYHLRHRWYIRALGVKDCKVIEFETKFSNDEWLLTSNAQAAGALEQPPGVDGIFLDADTCMETVIESHGKRVALYQQKHPDTAPCRVSTIEEATRLGAELQRRKAAHRRATGLTQQELQRIAGAPPSTEVAILQDGIAAGRKSDQQKAA